MKKIISLLVASIMIVSLAACAPNNEDIPEEPETQPIEDNIEDEEDKDQEAEEEKDEVVDEKDTDEEDTDEVVDEEDTDEEDKTQSTEETVDLYFANPEYISTGNEDLEKVKPESRTVDFEGTILEQAVVEELLKGPEDEDLDNGIPSSMSLIDVALIDGTAYVNFEEEGLGGASLQETLTIQQIVTSLLELDSVDAVQFLVNGEITESLMGHIITEEAFTEAP